MNSFADRLRQARQARGWTQEQLAEAADVSPGTIGNLESGTRQNPRRLLAIAHALGVTADWLLLGGAQEPAPRYAHDPAPGPEDHELRQALETLGEHLRRLPKSRRAAVAQLLAQWAATSDPRMLLALEALLLAP